MGVSGEAEFVPVPTRFRNFDLLSLVFFSSVVVNRRSYLPGTSVQTWRYSKDFVFMYVYMIHTASEVREGRRSPQRGALPPEIF